MTTKIYRIVVFIKEQGYLEYIIMAAHKFVKRILINVVFISINKLIMILVCLDINNYFF